jgi:hypothetical protein
MRLENEYIIGTLCGGWSVYGGKLRRPFQLGKSYNVFLINHKI